MNWERTHNESIHKQLVILKSHTYANHSCNFLSKHLNTHDDDFTNNINNDTDIQAQTANPTPTQTQTPNNGTQAEVFSTFHIQHHIKLPSSTSNKPPKYALVIVDNFRPIHSSYISNRARTVYGAAIIQQLSNYMSRYLLHQHNQTSQLQSCLPFARDQIKTWLEAIHHELGNSFLFGQRLKAFHNCCQNIVPAFHTIPTIPVTNTSI